MATEGWTAADTARAGWAAIGTATAGRAAASMVTAGPAAEGIRRVGDTVKVAGGGPSVHARPVFPRRKVRRGIFSLRPFTALRTDGSTAPAHPVVSKSRGGEARADI